jgi:molybdopterin synthase catalytic subunit
MSESPDTILISDRPLDASATIAAVSDGSAGGIAVFLGTTRAEKNKQGQNLLSLDYEAYEEMAIKQLHALAKHSREKWPICGLAILHRIGRVEVGQPSVLIAISTPHRAEAFEACKFIIDALKAQATIWKKEIWADGESTWVHPQ